MIEIIKNGTKRKMECEECGCIFRYDLEDRHLSFPEMGIGRPFFVVICPQCDNECAIKEEDL